MNPPPAQGLLLLSLLLSLGGCTKPEETPDAIRRAIFLYDIREWMEILRPQMTFCLAFRDPLDGGSSSADHDIDDDVGGLQAPSPAYIRRFQQYDLPKNPIIKSLSQCDGWFHSEARRKAALLVVKKIEFESSERASAELEEWLGHYARLKVMKLEKRKGKWEVVDSRLTDEG